MVADYLKEHPEANSRGVRSPISQDSDKSTEEEYEYDIYYFDDNLEEDDMQHKYQVYESLVLVYFCTCLSYSLCSAESRWNLLMSIHCWVKNMHRTMTQRILMVWI